MSKTLFDREFTTHSIRRSAARWAARCGANDTSIKRAGRWYVVEFNFFYGFCLNFNKKGPWKANYNTKATEHFKETIFNFSYVAGSLTAMSSTRRMQELRWSKSTTTDSQWLTTKCGCLSHCVKGHSIVFHPLQRLHSHMFNAIFVET